MILATEQTRGDIDGVSALYPLRETRDRIPRETRPADRFFSRTRRSRRAR